MPRTNLWARVPPQNKSSYSSKSIVRKFILSSSNGQDHLGVHSNTSMKNMLHRMLSHETTIRYAFQFSRRGKFAFQDCRHILQGLVLFLLRSIHRPRIIAPMRFVTILSITLNRPNLRMPGSDQRIRRICTMIDTTEMMRLVQILLISNSKDSGRLYHCLTNTCTTAWGVVHSSRLLTKCNPHQPTCRTSHMFRGLA